MRLLPLMLLVSSLTLTACGQSTPPQAPPPATAPAPVAAPKASTAPAASTTPHAATAPAAASAATASTSAAPATATTEGPEAAGGVSLAEGSVTDTTGDGSQRQLKDGDEVYPGDSLVLGDNSYLDIDFTDGGRVLLRPDTTFQVQQYHYEPEAHPGADGSPPIEIAPAKPENAFFSLVKGGLRAIDGIIGHTEPQNYGVQTPVATIGVRGTAFDVRYCGDDCQDEADATGAPQNGLYTAVNDGSIGVKNDTGETVSKAGEYSFVQSRKAAPQHRATPPRALRHMSLPEKFKARDEKNRTQVKARQQQRRAQIIQRRQQQKLHPPEGAGKARALEKGKAAQTPAERREQRQEQRERPQTGQGRGPENRGRNGQGASMTPAERRQQRLEERQQRQQQRQQQSPGAERREQVQPRRQENPAAATPATGQPQRREERQEQRQQQKAAQNPAAREIARPAPEKQQENKAPAKGKCKANKDKKKKEKCEG